MRRGRLGMLLSAVALVGAAFGAGAAQAAVTYDTSFGGPGNGKGQFFDGQNDGPNGIAVNYATGDVYVTDRFNHRVQQFDADGDFIRMWGRGVNDTIGGDLCTEASGHDCGPGDSGGGAGQFNHPIGIAVDNSTGPAAGSVYVQDRSNQRIQRFTAEGGFVLTWGRGVNLTAGGDICTAASGDTCKAGATSGDRTTSPPVPSVPGHFSPLTLTGASSSSTIAVDGEGYVYAPDSSAVPNSRVMKFSRLGEFVGQVMPPRAFGWESVGEVAVTPEGGLYGLDRCPMCGDGGRISFYEAADFSPAGTGAGYEYKSVREIHDFIGLDPANGFLLALGRAGGGGAAIGCPGVSGTVAYEYEPESDVLVDCNDVPQVPIVPVGGSQSFAISPAHKMYATNSVTHTVDVLDVPTPQPPLVGAQRATEITSGKFMAKAKVTPNLDLTTYRVEYGPQPCSASSCQSTGELDVNDEFQPIGASLMPQSVSASVTGLPPDSTVHYRFVATNGEGSTPGPDQSFRTLPSPDFDSSCPNNLARQQTGAAFLLDCRAYELVSAPDQGGYSVVSGLVPGQTPFGGYPLAADRALYAVHNGAIPGAGKPTNRGPDPYLASRDAANQRWNTEYVGIPADAPSAEPFSSTLAGADAGLGTFAFAGPEICDPCFPDGSSGIPVRRPDGSLVQGMVGGSPAIADPVGAGEVRKPLSADGSTLVFGSKQRFASGGNDNGTDASIYKRTLATGITRAVSVTPGAIPIQNGEGVAALDVSVDGSRVVVGELVSTDAEGNRRWRLYMHVGGAPNSIELTPGSAGGALYAGMNAAGTRVYFTTEDALFNVASPDTDDSADLYRADVGVASASLTRVSAGAGAGDTDLCDPAANSERERWNTVEADASCDVVAIGGGGGVASAGGAAYFLSPEALDTSGSAQPVPDAPNLYLSRPGQAPQLVASLESSDNQPLRPKAHLFERSFGSFSYPEGVAIDRASGSYYVYDTLSSTGADTDEDGQPNYTPGAYVQKFDSSGTPDVTFGVNSKVSSVPPTGPFLARGVGLSATFKTGLPAQLAVNQANGNLFVPDYANGVVNRFGPQGNYITQFSPKIGGTISDQPSGVAVDQATGNVYVTGTAGKAVYTFNANGTPIAPTSFAVTGTPLGVAVDSGGDVYVANGADTRVYGPTGTFKKVFDPNPSFGVSADPLDDHVYVNRGERVVEYDENGDPVATIGQGLLESSVAVFADAGRLVASNPGRSRAVAYGAPRIPPDPGYDSPLVLHSVGEAETRRTADFQTTPTANHAAFPSGMPLTGFESPGHYQVFRYATAGRELDCLSCNPTTLAPGSDAALPANGLGIADDGRVFFNTGEPLVVRDTNERLDAYEWSEEAGAGGRPELISSGQSNADSGLLSVSADGTDAFFFTRETLAANDTNGNLVKLYTAREGGGFFVIPPPPSCAASDECHGPSSAVPPPVSLGTLKGSGGNVPPAAKKPPPRCRKGFVKRRGKCVRKKGQKRAKKRKAKRAKQGGGRRG